METQLQKNSKIEDYILILYLLLLFALSTADNSVAPTYTTNPTGSIQTHNTATHLDQPACQHMDHTKVFW